MRGREATAPAALPRDTCSVVMVAPAKGTPSCSRTNRAVATLSEMAPGHPDMLPESAATAEALARVFDEVAGLVLIPAGGEQYGCLSVVAIPERRVRDFDEAVLALWKVLQCIVMEWPYEGWDAETVACQRKEYRADCERWLKCKSEDGFLEWLGSHGRETVRAQRELSKPSSPPRSLPDKDRVASLDLEALDYVNPQSLCAVLQNEWNDCEGLFKHRQHWFLAGWGTNA